MAKMKYFDQGSRSIFYAVSRTVGFKTFQSKKDAEYAYKIQKELAEIGYAPKVLSDVQQREIEGKKRWGFMTRRVSVLSARYRNRANLTWQQIYNDRDRLVNKLSNSGYYFHDSHTGNVGYISAGRHGRRMVCIDTGSESVYEI